MKHLALIAILCATAATAQAAEERSSLFACGINFGSKQLTYVAEPTSKKDYRTANRRLHYVVGAARTETLHFIPPGTSEFAKQEKRLPRKFTFATVGCSWR